MSCHRKAYSPGSFSHFAGSQVVVLHKTGNFPLVGRIYLDTDVYIQVVSPRRLSFVVGRSSLNVESSRSMSRSTPRSPWARRATNTAPVLPSSLPHPTRLPFNNFSIRTHRIDTATTTPC